MSAGKWALKAAACAALSLPGSIARADPRACLSSTEIWQSRSFLPESIAFEASFDAAPSDGAIDGVVGLSLGDASDGSSLAAAVRFNDSGFIDVLGANGYAADVRLRYTAATAYHFELAVDLVEHRYTVTVTVPGYEPVSLAVDYPFPDERRALVRLDRWSVRAASGSHRVCGFRSCAAPPGGVRVSARR